MKFADLAVSAFLILFPLAWALGVDGVWLTFPMVELVTAVAALVWAREYIIEN